MGCDIITSKLAQNQFEKAQKYDQVKDHEIAMKEYQRVITKYSNTIWATKAKERLTEYKNQNRVKHQFDSAVELCQNKEYFMAIIRLEEFIQEYPQSNLVPMALYRMGDCYEQVKRFNQAIKTYQRSLDHQNINPELKNIIKWRIESIEEDEKWYQQGIVLFKKGNFSEAKSAFLKIKEQNYKDMPRILKTIDKELQESYQFLLKAQYEEQIRQTRKEKQKEELLRKRLEKEKEEPWSEEWE